MSNFENGKKIIDTLMEHGYEAYFVGGFVRDFLLKIKSHDVDIATNARPEKVMELFQAIPTGLKYGTVTVLAKDAHYEVTTFRHDGEYLNNRHPDSVVFTNQLDEDLARRDFTINALAMDKYGRIIDYFDGKTDLENKIIRAILDPDTRFIEDALRILRAIYFVSKLGFDIEPETKASMQRKRFLIKNLSCERIQNEMKKVLKGAHVHKALIAMIETKVSESLAGLDKGIKFLVKHQLTVTLDEFYALCFTLNGEVPKQWKFSNADRKKFQEVVNLALSTENGDYNPLLLYSYGKTCALLACKVNYLRGMHEDLTHDIQEAYDTLPIKKTCDLVFKGEDIMKLTQREAASWLSDMVDKIKYAVLMGHIENSYETIKNFVLAELEKEESYEE